MLIARDLLRKSLNNHSQSDSWLVTTLREIHSTTEPTPSPIPFQLEMTSAAADHNTSLLAHQKFNYRRFLKKLNNTILNPGSEFRSLDALTKLWQHRPNWKTIRNILKKGCKYPLGPDRDDTIRLEDVANQYDRGNHQSAATDERIQILSKVYLKETIRSFLIPFNKEVLTKIPHLELIPIGVVIQPTFDINGNRSIKHRPIHDCSFPSKSGHSVNSQHIKDLLDECIYGKMIHRLLHQLHRLRLEFPNKRIIICKYDLDAAYRRLHMHPDHAVRAFTVFQDIAYLLTRLPFGAVAGPSLYSTISEAIFDLANDLMDDTAWNPTTLQSPLAPKLVPIPPNNNHPFGSAKPLLVHVPLRLSFVDGYIDDAVAMGVDVDDHMDRCQQAIPLCIHCVMRPFDTNEPTHRDDNLAEHQLRAEGAPTESQTVLGWNVCTRTFTIALPQEKVNGWSREIADLLQQPKVRAKEIESLIGRLNYAGFVIPHARYFINRIRYLHQRCVKYGPQPVNPSVKQDMLLWKEFLKYAGNGISINLLTYTTWDCQIFTDASELGIGGYNPHTGIGWRYKLPQWTSNLHINSIEFLAALVGLWVDLLHSPCLHKRMLCMTDSSSALAWLHKGNFNPVDQKVHESISRKLTRVMMDNQAALYSQHVKGSHNVIADSLSRDFHIDSDKLTFILRSLYPTQVGENFHILPQLPNEIICWIASLKGASTRTMESQSTPSRSKLGDLISGEDSWSSVESIVNSLMDSAVRKKSVYCKRMQELCEEISLGLQRKPNSLEAPSRPPYEVYVRPFGRTFGKIPY